MRVSRVLREYAIDYETGNFMHIVRIRNFSRFSHKFLDALFIDAVRAS